MLAWRIPVLRKYRYIVYHDGSLAVNTTGLYEQALKLIEGHSFVHAIHPHYDTMLAEARGEALHQPRYARDNVVGQAEHYIRDHLYPDGDHLQRLANFFIYDAWDPAVQVLLAHFWNRHLCVVRKQK